MIFLFCSEIIVVNMIVINNNNPSIIPITIFDIVLNPKNLIIIINIFGNNPTIRITSEDKYHIKEYFTGNFFFLNIEVIRKSQNIAKIINSILNPVPIISPSSLAQ